MTRATITMNRQAELRWSTYLEEIRLALQPLPQQEIEDIVEELESHLCSDVDTQGSRLSEQDIAALIARLGSPRHMAEAYGIQAPSEQPIAALDLALLFASLLLLLVSLLIPGVGPLLLIAGAVLARTAMQKSTVMSSPYRYLGYPVLVVAYMVLAVICLLWPLMPVLPVAATGGLLSTLYPESATSMAKDSGQYWNTVWSVAAIVTGLWWLLSSVLISSRDNFLQSLLQPFTSRDALPVATLCLVLRWAGAVLAATALAVFIINKPF